MTSLDKLRLKVVVKHEGKEYGSTLLKGSDIYQPEDTTNGTIALETNRDGQTLQLRMSVVTTLETKCYKNAVNAKKQEMLEDLIVNELKIFF